MVEKRVMFEGKETDYVVRDDGTVWNKKTGRQLKGTLARNEYPSVQLVLGGKPTSIMIHRLIAEYFCENPEGYNCVSHIDNDPMNNKPENLIWAPHQKGTKSEQRFQRKQEKKLTEEELAMEWKPINNSDYTINKDGTVADLRLKERKSLINRNGYKRVAINGNLFSVHILVWEAFNGPIPQGMVIDHIDSNRANNKLSNLRMITQSENMQNAMEHGHKCQVKVLQEDAEGNIIKEYPSIQRAADACGMSREYFVRFLDCGRECCGYYFKRKPKN